ncbi:hypothetical protein ACOBV8_19895 (plasmid) [Pseudoalteromonas espejiana]
MTYFRSHHVNPYGKKEARLLQINTQLSRTITYAYCVYGYYDDGKQPVAKNIQANLTLSVIGQENSANINILIALLIAQVLL